MIREPSAIRNDPASFVALGAHCVKLSRSENLKNKSSCVAASVTVVHVPNKNKCLVSDDTKEKREATGAVAPRLTALVDVPPEVSH